MQYTTKKIVYLLVYVILILPLVPLLTAALPQPEIKDGAAGAVALSVRLERVRKITSEERFHSPTWSPDGLSLAFVNPTGTFLFAVPDGTLHRTSDQIAGFGFFWAKDGESLVYRHQSRDGALSIRQMSRGTGEVYTLAEAPDLGMPQEVVPGLIRFKLLGQARAFAISEFPSAADERPFAYQENDDIFIEARGTRRKITTGDGKYFLPQVSPAGSKVLFQEISKGLFVFDLRSGRTSHIGRGDDAAWSPDGKYVLFEKTVDDGHTILASDLHMANLEGHEVRLTDSPDRIEMRSSWSPSGNQIAFDAEGAIYIADLVSGD